MNQIITGFDSCYLELATSITLRLFLWKSYRRSLELAACVVLATRMKSVKGPVDAAAAPKPRCPPFSRVSRCVLSGDEAAATEGAADDDLDDFLNSLDDAAPGNAGGASSNLADEDLDKMLA